MTQHTNPI